MTVDMDSLSDVVGAAVETHPEPSDQAAAIVEEVMIDADGVARGDIPDWAMLDAKGSKHDPAIHATPPDRTRRGTWRLRPVKFVGANGVAGDAPPTPAPPGDVGTVSPLAPPPVDTRAQAQGWVDLSTSLCATLLGPGWQPRAEERDNLTGATERFMAAHGYNGDLPPGMALVAAVAMYAVPRAYLPETRERVAALASKLRRKPATDTDQADAYSVDELHTRSAA